MIYTVTLNPSLDYIVDVKDFCMGAVNRSRAEVILAGGKGINVSLMLRELGCESQALGLLAGFTGEEIRRLLVREGISERFLFLENGFSRINVKLKSGDVTEINGAGPCVSDTEKEAFLLQLESSLCDGDILVLSGSVPRSLPSSIYTEIIRRLSDKRVRIVADVSGGMLWDILPYHPFLIKPNHHELGELFGCRIDSREQAAAYAQILQSRGAENVLVSLAQNGAVLATASGIVYANAPTGTAVNAVGAGDSAVAGFLAGWLSSGNVERALALAVAAGSATAFSEGIGKRETVEALLEQMNAKG